MRKSFLNIISFTLMAVFLTTAYTVQAQVRAYRVTDRQVQTLINRIETRTDTFKSQLGRALDRSALNGTSSEDLVNSYVCAGNSIPVNPYRQTFRTS
jgi:signal transduction histidine kinase